MVCADYIQLQLLVCVCVCVFTTPHTWIYPLTHREDFRNRYRNEEQRTGVAHLDVHSLSGKYPPILNISRTVRVALMKLGSQSEETLRCILD